MYRRYNLYKRRKRYSLSTDKCQFKAWGQDKHKEDGLVRADVDAINASSVKTSVTQVT